MFRWEELYSPMSQLDASPVYKGRYSLSQSFGVVHSSMDADMEEHFAVVMIPEAISEQLDFLRSN